MWALPGFGLVTTPLELDIPLSETAGLASAASMLGWVIGYGLTARGH